MPRIDGIYTPPAGTKGTPNTVIQSSKYNALVDDVAADLNGARPVTAGGTSANNATDARENLGANNASNLIKGTVDDARLPTTQTGKTFTGTVTVEKSAAGDYLSLTPSGWGAGKPLLAVNKDAENPKWNLTLWDGTTVAGHINVNAATFTFYNHTIWHAGNDGSGSGLDADFLRGLSTSTANVANTIVARTGVGNIIGHGLYSAQDVNYGTVYLGSNGSHYLNWDGAKYNLVNGGVSIGGNLTAGGATFYSGNGNIGFADWMASTYGANLSDALNARPLTSRAINAGNGLTGGGSLGADVTLNVGAGTGIAVAADTVSVDGTVWRDALSGGNPSLGWVKFPSGLILQAGSSTVTTNSNADGSVNFPTTFPNAAISVMACGGDVAVPLSLMEVATPLVSSGFSFRANGAASQSVRVNWFAWGY